MFLGCAAVGLLRGVCYCSVAFACRALGRRPFAHAPSAVDMPCGRPSDAGSARQGDFRSSDQSASAAVSCGGRGRVVSGADPWARLVISRESPGTSAAWGNRAHPERLEQVGFGESLSATGGPSRLTDLRDRLAVAIHPVCLGSRLRCVPLQGAPSLFALPGMVVAAGVSTFRAAGWMA